MMQCKNVEVSQVAFWFGSGPPDRILSVLDQELSALCSTASDLDSNLLNYVKTLRRVSGRVNIGQQCWVTGSVQLRFKASAPDST